MTTFPFSECGSNSSSNVDSGEFSSISLVVNRDSTLRCTASIISPLWAMTSSDCVSKPDQEWILIAGSTELNMSKISKDSVISLIGNIVTYPGVSGAMRLCDLTSDLFLNFAEWFCVIGVEASSGIQKSDLLGVHERGTIWIDKEMPNHRMVNSRVKWVRFGNCSATIFYSRFIDLDNSYEKYEKITAIDRNCTSQADSICVTPQNRLSSECYVRRLVSLFLFGLIIATWLFQNDKGAALYCYSESHSRWLLNGLQNKQNSCQDAAQPSVFTGLSAKTITWIKNTVGNSRMFV